MTNVLLGQTYFYHVVATNLFGWSVGLDHSVMRSHADLKVAKLNSSQAEVSFRGQVGLTYNVEVSTDLKTWTPIGAASTTWPGQFHYRDTNAAGPQRFYRITE